ncbi:zinc finger protein ZAT9-like [Salvia miltiorrhiza]|uniref:zinc finger protein ZAT9-like n=1 Tax=Salvia miltiorrhiza TaxID=226208 RepID=UPI0025AC3ED5|nr:zinc finger protein ZAT9-like [Salvia miltiorrhiza]XP_057811518.1 zinc finger protein ZAT9-like [Salvia miltiorrhiza]
MMMMMQKLKKPRVEAKTRKLESQNTEVEVGCDDEVEVNSPKNLNKKSFRKDREAERNNRKFRCSMCKKAFQLYQALGGHRASHNKFKGCCAPQETEDSQSQLGENLMIMMKKSKEHECPICFKVILSAKLWAATRDHHHHHHCFPLLSFSLTSTTTKISTTAKQHNNSKM